MYTEKEASEKWCPFARTISRELPVAGNRVGAGRVTEALDSPATCRCIGSRCMAWRFGLGDSADAPRLGYCGLAGKHL